MAFKTSFGSADPCVRCGQPITPGAIVVYADDDRKSMAHNDCNPGEFQEDREEILIHWGHVTEESLERIERAELEELQVAPLGPQGVCPRCFIELPRSKVCGTC